MMISVRRRRPGRRVASADQPLLPLTGRRRCVCLIAAAAMVAAATIVAVAQTAPSADVAPTAPAETAPARSAGPKTPPGMVRYDHPVVRNGKVILWRGAWRERLKSMDRGQNAKNLAPGAKDLDQ